VSIKRPESLHLCFDTSFLMSHTASQLLGILQAVIQVLVQGCLYLKKKSVLKSASFSTGCLRENNYLMSTGNKLLFYSLNVVCHGKFQVHCRNNGEGVYVSAPCVTQFQWDMFTIGTSHIVFFEWESASFFFRENHGNISG